MWIERYLFFYFEIWINIVAPVTRKVKGSFIYVYFIFFLFSIKFKDFYSRKEMRITKRIENERNLTTQININININLVFRKNKVNQILFFSFFKFINWDFWNNIICCLWFLLCWFLEGKLLYQNPHLFVEGS